MYDVIIIGAGVTGSAVARELSRYKLNVCVLEKEEDVCCGTSKANSAIIHAGFDAAEGSLMARFNVRGNEMMDQLAADLDIPFKRNGAMVVCIHESEKDGLKDLYDRGVANGVKGLQILNREEALEKEPNLSEKVVAALYAPTSGIVCPFILNIAMAENANVNGVEFFFNTEVEKLINLYPYYENVTLPAETYNGLSGDVNTIGVRAVLVVSNSCKEDTVYKLLRAVTKHSGTLNENIVTDGETNLSKAAENVSIPFNPGAAKYYSENGITVATSSGSKTTFVQSTQDN